MKLFENVVSFNNRQGYSQDFCWGGILTDSSIFLYSFCYFFTGQIKCFEKCINPPLPRLFFWCKSHLQVYRFACFRRNICGKCRKIATGHSLHTTLKLSGLPNSKRDSIYNSFLQSYPILIWCIRFFFKQRKTILLSFIQPNAPNRNIP